MEKLLGIKCQIIDPRIDKIFEGYLTDEMKLGQPLIIPLADKATEFYINKIQRMLSINNKHWIVDKYGVRFVIIV